MTGRPVRRSQTIVVSGLFAPLLLHKRQFLRRIEQVLDVQVDLRSVKMFRRPRYAVQQLTADFLIGYAWGKPA